jgi:hypothetical protein
MADHNPQHGRRPHFHRGRRGPDRRGSERRLTQREREPDTGSREPREPRDNGSVDVEQIMRDIRARIAQRHGIELNTQQIQELAARRLEAILEPRNVKPQLLEQLRRSAGSAPDIPAATPLETYEFEDTTLYETHRGVLSFLRRLLNPILKLFFNPTPLINALNTQARINKALAARELERERRQSEWNALQYELVQRAVLETSRVSIEMQALSARVESLSTKVDFNDRKIRTLESTPPTSAPRPAPRHQEPIAVSSVSPPELPAADAASGEGTGESRRRRRRRRGRRGGGAPGDSTGPAATLAAVDDDIDAADAADIDEDEPDASETTSFVAASAPASPFAGVPEAPPPTESAPEPEASPAARSTPWASSASLQVTGPPPAQEPSAPQTLPEPHTPATSPVTPTGTAPLLPTPPRDEPTPEHPVDRADPGPEDR